MGQACVKHGEYNSEQGPWVAAVTDLRLHWGRVKIRS